MSSARPVASSRSGRVLKAAPLLADPSNVARPETSSHRVAVLTAEAERKAALVAKAVREAVAAEPPPEITPPPEAPSASASASSKRPRSPSVETVDENNDGDGDQVSQKSKHPVLTVSP